jgi:hypothetical protein
MFGVYFYMVLLTKKLRSNTINAMFSMFFLLSCRIHRADSIKALEDEKKRQEEARLKEEQAKLKEEQAKLDQVSSVSSFEQLFCLAF